ncbi:MAG: hypothetical protein RSD88_04825 [Anaerovoracaceae bacterium]
MPLVILGVLMIAIVIIYMKVSKPEGDTKGKKVTSKKIDNDTDDTSPESLIYLPKDLEKEKKKRHVKTGK